MDLHRALPQIDEGSKAWSDVDSSRATRAYSPSKHLEIIWTSPNIVLTDKGRATILFAFAGPGSLGWGKMNHEIKRSL